MMRLPPVLVALLLLGSTAYVGCKREPPEITEEQAKSIAEKEFPKWCSTEGNKCSDFKPRGKQKPIEPNWEWAWSWHNEITSTLMIVQVDKKGLAAMRVQAFESEAAPASAHVAAPPVAAAVPVPATAPKPAPLLPGMANVASETVSILAKLPGIKKGEGRTWKSIQCNPGLWKRLIGSDPTLKTKGLPSMVAIGPAKMERRLFGNQLAIDELRSNHQFQKFIAPYAMGGVRAPSQAEQDKLFAYFPELLAKPVTIVDQGNDTLLIQESSGALVMDLITGYPAPPRAVAPAGATTPGVPPTPGSEPPKPEGPTFKEVFAACETEIGILCLVAPESIPQARRCLQPHRAALRNSCGRTVGLKRWP